MYIHAYNMYTTCNISHIKGNPFRLTSDLQRGPGYNVQDYDIIH